MAVRVEGRGLSPLINVFDNLDEVESFLVQAGVCEDIIADPRTGIVYFGSGFARIGNYLVTHDGIIDVYTSLEDLQDDHEVVS